MRWAFGIGRWLGIPVRVHVTFLVFAAWIAVSQGINERDVGHALVTLALLLLVFLCVLLHELGHAMAARHFGVGTRDIVLLPFGGVARLERMPEKPVQEIVVALAGPAVNLAIAGLLWVVLVALQSRLALGLGTDLLPALLTVNVVMLLFNLIPAFPMDGGRVLRATLALRLPFASATRIAATIGQAIALVFGAIGLFSGQHMLLLVALFIFLAAGEERAVVNARHSLTGLPVRAAMLVDFRMVSANDPLQRAVDHLMAGSQQDFPVLEGGQLEGMLTRADLVRALQQGGPDQRVADVMTRRPSYAEGDEALEHAMQRMRQKSLASLPVLERGRLIGLLTLENIGDLLSVREALRKHAQ